jgi:hypothetical protein
MRQLQEFEELYRVELMAVEDETPEQRKERWDKVVERRGCEARKPLMRSYKEMKAEELAERILDRQNKRRTE